MCQDQDGLQVGNYILANVKIISLSRPGIVDLPIDGAVANSDTITLPEIFHDFETAVADLG